MTPDKTYYKPENIGYPLCNADGELMCDASGNILAAALRGFVRVYAVDWKRLRDSGFEDNNAIKYSGGVELPYIWGVAYSVDGGARTWVASETGGAAAHYHLERYTIPTGGGVPSRVEIYGIDDRFNTALFGSATINFSVVDQLGNVYRKTKTYSPGELCWTETQAPTEADYRLMLIIYFNADGTVMDIN